MSTSAENNINAVAIKSAAGIDYATLLALVPFGQSKYQTESFLTEQHRTPHRQLRQILLQYDQLCHTLLSTRSSVQKAKLDLDERHNQIARLKDQIENANLDKFDLRDTEIKIAKIEIELADVESGRAQSEKLIADAMAEKETFEGLLQKIVPKVMELEAAGVTFDVAEKDYWRARFIEDAKLEMFCVANGRKIDKEIMRAITQMPVEDQNFVVRELGMPENAIAAYGLIAVGTTELGLNLPVPASTKQLS